MKPRDYQIALSMEGYNILKEYMICYLAMEERTGKSLTAIMIAEQCASVKNVLIVTKKKAIADWVKLIHDYSANVTKKYRVCNYHQVHKYGRPDLMILDEAHNYISGYPKQPAIHSNIQNISQGIPLIYLSATPHAQGYQMLFHQLSLSSWSPWRRYKTFLEWFFHYGEAKSAHFHGRSVPVYTTTKEEKVKPDVDHLFIRETRKGLGFEHEPVDKLHFIELSPTTRDVYNELMKDKFIEINDYELACDTGMKLRSSLHMLEGGVLKIEDDYLVLKNKEKINYIMKTWGDTDDIVIYYHYVAEGKKLRAHFKNATILQGTSYAEGIDLTDKDTVIIYSQDFSTARHTQRRARQASMHRESAIVVHFLLVKKAVSAQVYHTVSINKQNFVDSVFERYYI